MWSSQNRCRIIKNHTSCAFIYKYGLTVHGSVQILRRSNFGTSLICVIQKEICTIWLSAECHIYRAGLQSIKRHIKLNSVTLTVRAEGSLSCCEVDGAILTSKYNEMLHCRRTVTKAGSDVSADAVLVFGVVIYLIGEWLYVSWFGTNKTYRTIKITQWLSCPLALQRLRHCWVRITLSGGFMNLQESMERLWPWENVPQHTAVTIFQFSNAFRYCDNPTVNYEQNKCTGRQRRRRQRRQVRTRG